MSDPIKCPECIQGKHGNCDGDAYDFATESTVPCDCQCIGDAYKAASQPSPQQSDVQPGDRAGEAQDGLSAFADAVARVTPCSCSAQRQRAEAAEAKVAEVRLGRAELADEVQALRDQVANLPDRTRAAEAEVERLQQVSDGYEVFVREVSPRLLAAEAKLTRVEALAEEWDRSTTKMRLAFFVAADDLRAALADAASPSGLDDDAPTEAVIPTPRGQLIALLDALDERDAKAARVEALADDLTREVEELRVDLPSAGASRVAHLYRTTGLSDAGDRLRAAITNHVTPDAPASEATETKG